MSLLKLLIIIITTIIISTLINYASHCAVALFENHPHMAATTRVTKRLAVEKLAAAKFCVSQYRRHCTVVGLLQEGVMKYTEIFYQKIDFFYQ